MNIFLVIALAMLLIIILLRRHIPIGPAILAGGLLIWALVAPQFHYLVSAFTTTLTMQRTYDLILALYFVMCLEIELRTSGAFRRNDPRPAALIYQRKIYTGHYASFSRPAAFAGRRTFFCAHRRSGQPQYRPYQRT